MITETNEQVPDLSVNPFDQLNGTYIKLERDKAKVLLITDWKIEVIQKFKDDKASKELGRDVLKKQLEFSAKVLNEDGRPTTGIFTTTSLNAMKGLKEVLSKYFPDTKTPRLIRIKKIGEGIKTMYDIEEQEIKAK